MLAKASYEMQVEFNKLFQQIRQENSNSNIFLGIPYHCKLLNTLEDGMVPGIHENHIETVNLFLIKFLEKTNYKFNKNYSSVALHQVMIHEPFLFLYFLQTIKKNNNTILLVNNEFLSKKEDLELYFGNNISFVTAPANNSFTEKDAIVDNFRKLMENKKKDEFVVCILALGCGGRAMSHYLYQYPNIFLLDIGSPIDALMGLKNTRAWVEMTNPNIDFFKQQLQNKSKLENETSLTLIGEKHGTDKALYHKYTSFYDSLFCKWRNNDINFFEIGVLSGNSVKMWREYFTNPKATIHCFDKNTECVNYISELFTKNVFFHQVDQDSRESLQESIKFQKNKNVVDIILDDGGHCSSQQKKTLEVFWPLLKSGGMYVIEDIHTNVPHWYPEPCYYDKSRFYWDETPTLLEHLKNLQIGISVDQEKLNIPRNEIRQIISWSQPSTTSLLYILIKN